MSDIKTIKIEDIIQGASKLQITYQEALRHHDALSPVSSHNTERGGSSRV